MKANYTHSKINLSVLGGAIFFAILGNIWGEFFYLIEGIFKLTNHNSNQIEAGKIIIIVFLTVVITITIFLLLIVAAFFRNLTKLYKNLLLVENIKEKRIK